MQSSIMDYVTKYNILSAEQYGLKQTWKQKMQHKLPNVIFNALNIKWTGGRFFCETEKLSIA